MNNTGNVNWFGVLKRGQHYMNTWPDDKRLSPVFPEHRVGKAIRFGIRFMPPVSVFTLCWQIALHAQTGPAVASALFACSLPIQGLWWMGKRAMKPLPPTLLQWYHSVRTKLEQAGQPTAIPEGEPTYQSLADLLKRAFRQLDKTFLDDL
ncbi:terminus macrodomain insulation protein YfbV [Tatumella terrea]|uniref:UPF0208 membrane protein ACFP9W_06095 n=1 Tax=Tatumella terrea TaxID=419007 RepID=A0ABW1VXV9_9GAMM